MDKSGKVTCCLICKSIYHWANSCLNKVKDTLEDVNVTLFTLETHECYIAKFVGETFTCTVLDSGCTKNVCLWLSNYLDTLTEVGRSQVSEKEAVISFRFGDKNSVKSEKTAIFPGKIGQKNIMIRTDVVGTDLPMLLSKSAMKKANMKIDFSNDTVSMFDQKVNVGFTSSGHYAVPIGKTNQLVEDFDNKNLVGQVYLTITELSKKSNDPKLTIANKLHCQFGHASPEKLKKLTKASDINDQELLDIIDLVDQLWQVCLKYKKLN